jgi:predicted porin
VAGSFERGSNTIQYTSPSISGLVVNANYASNSSDADDVAGKSKASQSGIGATFAAGPLSIGAGMQDRKVQGTFVNAYAPATTTLQGAATEAATTAKGKLNWIGASYNLGVASVSAAQINRKDTNTSDAVVTKLGITALGVAVPMGAITLNASVYTGTNDKTTATNDDVKLSGYQLSARYAFSKRTSAYAVMGEAKSKADGTNTAKPYSFTSNAIGLVHTF